MLSDYAAILHVDEVDKMGVIGQILSQRTPIESKRDRGTFLAEIVTVQGDDITKMTLQLLNPFRQLVEWLPRKQQVQGSIPCKGLFFIIL